MGERENNFKDALVNESMKVWASDRNGRKTREVYVDIYDKVQVVSDNSDGTKNVVLLDNIDEDYDLIAENVPAENLEFFKMADDNTFKEAKKRVEKKLNERDQ
ncbi:hypothetical protein LQ318_07070 [Aliifodinibius salicampi]|uniref:DUF5611 domain-containing protein n=1 Tax=Fodinibius salicampi TaxID=1920655 RepID=A0ABT3PXS7_9BACT|nr:hypothetical protein [Fodinibius salicampi]MCW9712661.1 hypothetical protein [Fodinibius salicampi]